jgi:molecular chaperone GrpE
VDLISNKIRDTLARRGLKPFESVGQPFDVNLHDALLQIPREDLPPGTVVEEVGRGYYLNDRVLRHAKVVVSSTVDSPEPPSGEVASESSGGD